MYTHNANQLIMPDEFFLPFGGSLNPDNRWIIMASLIPWAEAEEEYIKRLGNPKEGSKTYSVRLALGTLIIKEKMGLSDEETVLAITENPYLQYFIGLHEFQEKPPFDSSTITHFRKRFDMDFINDISERIVQKQQAVSTEKHSKDEPPNDDSGISSGGTPDSKETMDNDKQHQGKLLFWMLLVLLLILLIRLT